jgi:hypothetical protein
MSIESKKIRINVNVEGSEMGFRQQLYSHTENLVAEAWKERYDSNSRIWLTDNKKRADEITTNLKVLKMFFERGDSCSDEVDRGKQIAHVVGNIVKFGGFFDKDLRGFCKKVVKEDTCSDFWLEPFCPYGAVSHALKVRMLQNGISKEEKEGLSKQNESVRGLMSYK